MKLKFLLMPLMVAALAFSCDIYKPQKKFKLAIPEKDYFYNYMASHLKPFLDRNGYQLIIIKTSSSIEAVRMAASGEADLAFINNQSTAIADVLDEETGKLRTMMPLTTRLLFAFSKKAMPDTATAKELLEHKRIGLESLNGEDHLKAGEIRLSYFIQVDPTGTLDAQIPMKP